MKSLLLTLVVGLLCVKKGSFSGVELSPEITGNWYSIYVTADNKEKIAEDGPLRAYLRHIDYQDDGQTVSFTFYAKVNGQCQEFTAVGTRGDNNIYEIDYSGSNYFYVPFWSDEVAIFYVVNKDETDKVTHVLEIFAKTNDISEEDYQKFVKLASENGLPVENIVKSIETDTCPGNIN